jgi:hypothetical protein
MANLLLNVFLYLIVPVLSFFVFFGLLVWPSKLSCFFGFHDWYRGNGGTYSCGTFYKTGSLPGERLIANGQGVKAYRKERSCLCCNRAQYYNFDIHQFVTVPGFHGLHYCFVNKNADRVKYVKRHSFKW